MRVQPFRRQARRYFKTGSRPSSGGQRRRHLSSALFILRLVWCGLRRYGFTAEAAQVAARTRRVLAEEFRRSDVMYENYDPETGCGVACPGFWSWNILAAVME